MAARRLVTASRGCGHCRSSVLYAFASLAGITLPPPPQRAIPFVQAPLTHKSFSTSLFRRNDESQLELVQQGHSYGVDSSPEEVAKATPRQGDNDLPWYLQVAGPPKHTSPLSARHQIPPVPEDSPELLKPFLEHLSESIGLDDLTLLDLRVLDPPPALGANLMMVVGTARSEKHLHVSADRFCRWLRTNHKLSPYADGLLGRNELKLKMRRKARRIKLLSSVGSVEDKNVDDGIRTGWVCVNIGEIEPGEQDIDEGGGTNGFVGFGGGNNGVRLVVQMMTQEKREELDLETLWGGYVTRQQRKEAREARKDGEALLGHVEQVGGSVSKTWIPADASPLLSSQSYKLTDSTHSTVQQRGMHTAILGTIRSRKVGSDQKLSHQYSNSAGANTSSDPVESLGRDLSVKGISPPPEPHFLSNETQSSNATGNSFLESKVEVIPDLDTTSAAGVTSEEDIKAELSNLIKHLDRLSPEDAREALGQGPQDETSTAFLQTFNQYTKRLEDIQQVRFRMRPPEHKVARNHPEYYRARLFSRGVARQHEGYTKESLVQHLHSLQETGAVIGISTYAEYIKGLAAPDYEVDVMPGAATHEYHQASEQSNPMLAIKQRVITRDSLGMILEVLEDMHMCGFNLAHKDILPVLCEALARSQFSEQCTTQPRVSPDAVHRITQIMFRHRLPVMLHAHYEELLECFVNAGNWNGYWQCWRGLARRSQTRTPKLYQNLFRHLADTSNQKMCLDALREWIPELDRESPPIGLQGNEVLVCEIIRCLRVADPRSEQMAAEGEQLGEWRGLWQRLFDASQPAYNSQKATLSDERVENPGFWNQSFTENIPESISNEVDGSDEELMDRSEDMDGDFSQLYGLKT